MHEKDVLQNKVAAFDNEIRMANKEKLSTKDQLHTVEDERKALASELIATKENFAVLKEEKEVRQS